VRWAVDHTGPVGAAAEWAFDGLGYLLASGISWADEHTGGRVSSALHWVDGETYGGAVRRGLRDTLGVNQRVAQNVGDATRYVFDIALALLPITPAGRARTLAQFEKGSAKVLTKAGAERGAARIATRKVGEVGLYRHFKGKIFNDGCHAHHIIPQWILERFGIRAGDGPVIVLKMPQHIKTQSYGSRSRVLPHDFSIMATIESNIDDVANVLRTTGHTTEEIGLARNQMHELCEAFLREHGSHFPQL
jgi:hypothetical protein